MDTASDDAFRQLAEQRKKPRRDWESEIEKSISEAQSRGDFDKLPGHGQPLKWDSDYDDENWLANRVLKNAGFTPAWIEDDQAIRVEREALAQLLGDFVAWWSTESAALVGLPTDAGRTRRAELDAARARRITAYRERAAKLNRLIDSFNLTVPLAGKQHTRLRIDAEIAAFEARLG